MLGFFPGGFCGGLGSRGVLLFSRDPPTLANCCVNADECVINVVEILLCIWYCEFVIFGQENAFYVL